MNIAIIPARSGSKAIVNKNIQLINEIPLLAHSIVTAMECNLIDRVFCSSDNIEYLNIAEEYGAETIHRPDFLSTDSATDYDYLMHFIHNRKLEFDDNVVLLRPTTPQRDISIVDTAIKQFYEVKGYYHSLRSVQELPESPHKMYRWNDNNKDTIKPYMDVTNEQANNPRQHHIIALKPNGYVDITSVQTLIQTRSVYGENVYGYLTNPVIEIDSEFELQLVKMIMEK